MRCARLNTFNTWLLNSKMCAKLIYMSRESSLEALIVGKPVKRIGNNEPELKSYIPGLGVRKPESTQHFRRDQTLRSILRSQIHVWYPGADRDESQDARLKPKNCPSCFFNSRNVR